MENYFVLSITEGQIIQRVYQSLMVLYQINFVEANQLRISDTFAFSHFFLDNSVQNLMKFNILLDYDKIMNLEWSMN